MIERMSVRPLLLAEEGIRLSLAGAQEKIALAYIDGAWCVPLNGAPSTHILKPGYPGESRFPDIAVNEYICMQLALKLGLPVPETMLLDIQGIPVFCIARYDRTIAEIAGKASIRRIHQEDFCQALGIMSDRKYQADGGPSLVQIAALIREYSSSPILDIPLLMRMVLFQYLIGNCDAHGKNYSLLYSESGRVGLAPSYDSLSTAIYPGLSRRMSMKIGGTYELDRIDTEDFTELLTSVQLKPSFLGEMREGFASGFSQGFEEIEALPELVSHTALVSRIREGFLFRLERLSF
jgi:serine/threonine-protein kinase HipA